MGWNSVRQADDVGALGGAEPRRVIGQRVLPGVLRVAGGWDDAAHATMLRTCN